jgi:hypothetical protein
MFNLCSGWSQRASTPRSSFTLLIAIRALDCSFRVLVLLIIPCLRLSDVEKRLRRRLLLCILVSTLLLDFLLCLFLFLTLCHLSKIYVYLIFFYPFAICLILIILKHF